jgi:ligand-binding SRPBCC domain-containing protein
VVALKECTLICAPIERCFDLARSIEVHLAGNIHWGEKAIAAGGVTSGLIELGQSVTWQARHFGLRQRLTSKITAMERPTYFRDTMTKGAFRSMHHEHRFRALSATKTEMVDVFVFSAPFGLLGRIAELALLKAYMRSLLRERNTVLREIVESPEWQEYLPDQGLKAQWFSRPG